MLLTTVLLWSLNFTVTKYVLTHGFRPLAYSTIRYGAAAVIFAGFTAQREGTLSVRRRDLWLLGLAAVVGIWMNQLGYVYAIRFGTASTTALILGITPIFAAAGAWAVGLERLSRRFWLAALVSSVGVALVAIGSGGGISTNLKGDLFAVFTAATWAAYSLAITPLMRRYSSFRVSAIVLLLGWIPLAATAAPQLAKQDFHLHAVVWLMLVYAVVGPLVVTNVLWFTAIGRVGPSRATLFANLQPFVATVFAVLLLSESIGWIQIVGGALIGLALLLSRARRPPVPPAD
ncbi:MAG: DMT family transporter [Gaiellaceae bacterium]